MRIDAHQHFWKHNPEEFGWVSDEMAVLRRDFMPADLKPLLDAAGYEGCIAVQAAQTVEETRFLLGLAEEHDWIRGVVGWVDLFSPLDAELLDHPKLVGVRHIVQAEAPGFLSQPRFWDGVASLAQRGLTYDLLIYHHQMEEAFEFVSALPKVAMVLDHAAKPPIREGQFEPWASWMQKLSDCPNLHVKLSGLAFEADWGNWSSSVLRPWISHVIECFGADRCMIGSDWPVSLCAGDYERVMGDIEECLGGDAEAICGGNASRFYGLDIG